MADIVNVGYSHLDEKQRQDEHSDKKVYARGENANVLVYYGDWTVDPGCSSNRFYCTFIGLYATGCLAAPFIKW